MFNRYILSKRSSSINQQSEKLGKNVQQSAKSYIKHSKHFSSNSKTGTTSPLQDTTSDPTVLQHQTADATYQGNVHLRLPLLLSLTTPFLPFLRLLKAFRHLLSLTVFLLHPFIKILPYPFPWANQTLPPTTCPMFSPHTCLPFLLNFHLLHLC